jgi:hypothetical protein
LVHLGYFGSVEEEAKEEDSVPSGGGGSGAKEVLMPSEGVGRG